MTEALAHAHPLERVEPQRPRVRAAPEIKLPAWRGVMHEKAFAFAPALSVLLVASAVDMRGRVAATIFAITCTAMLAASTLNHRALLAGRWQMRLRRADHAGIGGFVIGTWVSFALAVSASAADLIAAGCGIVLAAPLATTASLRLPRGFNATLTVGAGWCATFILPDIAQATGTAGAALFVAGGLLYTAGAVVYALRRPVVHPQFGHHELFHALVLAGVGCHYVTLALLT